MMMSTWARMLAISMMKIGSCQIYLLGHVIASKGIMHAVCTISTCLYMLLCCFHCILQTHLPSAKQQLVVLHSHSKTLLKLLFKRQLRHGALAATSAAKEWTCYLDCKCYPHTGDKTWYKNTPWHRAEGYSVYMILTGAWAEAARPAWSIQPRQMKLVYNMPNTLVHKPAWETYLHVLVLNRSVSISWSQLPK